MSSFDSDTHPTPSPAPSFESPFDPVRKYFRDLKALLLSPTSFFRRVPRVGGLAGPLTFALVTHWVGRALEFFWSGLFGLTVHEQIERYLRLFGENSGDARNLRVMMSGGGRSEMLEWVLGVGSVIADPFFTLLGVLGVATLVLLGARMIVPKSATPLTYESAVRVVSYGLAPSILQAIPWMGGFVTPIYVIVVTTIGAREFYGISGRRALFVALFPKLLIYGMIFLVIFFFVAVFLGLLSVSLFQ